MLSVNDTARPRYNRKPRGLTMFMSVYRGFCKFDFQIKGFFIKFAI